MDNNFSRRKFLKKGIAAGAILPLSGMIFQSAGFAQSQPQQRSDRGPRLALETVEEFVRVAHGNLARVKEMLEKQPALINATWDWGGGDWETGLGGASHMGRRDIALYLLGHNARMDVFAAAMLGKLQIVKAAIAAFPGIPKVPGPHGIPLIVHARKGGEEAAAVLEFLERLAQS